MVSSRILISALLVACANQREPTCDPAEGSALSGTLASYAESRGIWIGDFTFTASGDGAFQRSLAEFDMTTLPVYMQLAEPSDGVFDFSLADSVADAAGPGTVFYIPGLIWNEHKLLPAWLQTGSYSGSQLRDVLTRYVTTVVQHFMTKYPGRIAAIEPVLEPLSYQGPSGLWNQIGLDVGGDPDEYMVLAFETARAAAPSVPLYLDDFGAEGMTPKADALFELVAKLRALHVPLDGVGLEGHFMIEPGGSFPDVPAEVEIVANLDRFAGLGVTTMITSADLSMLDADVSSTLLDAQARSYVVLLDACLTADRCVGFSTWGVSDADTWITKQFPGWGTPLLFDEAYAPKPAYDAVKARLSAACAP